jgi:hypothetical protein
MLTQLAWRFAASERRRKASSGAPIALLLLPFALAFFTHGCSGAPPAPLTAADPSDPAARAPPVGYRSTIGSYKSQRPVEPAPWGEQNERVAPRPKSGP